jgi:hypothetical protein
MRSSSLRCFRRAGVVARVVVINSARSLVMIREAICGWYSIVVVVKFILHCTRKFYLGRDVNEIMFNINLFTK